MVTRADYSQRTAVQKLDVKPGDHVDVVGDVGTGLRRDVKALCEILEVYREAAEAPDERRGELRARAHGLAEAIDLPYTLAGLDDMSAMAALRAGLRRRYGDDADAICQGNALRVLRAGWRAAA